ncbi:hypothetical protein A2641_03515 [Candidatus Nomurabacteria bacterium RIFCSPHIGHO2_01_FULL_37_25]|uniref:UDP-N-acetylmuramoyl-L-alanyl-D-glutamate--2,6-diaminopimelate ligase n=1 Tax=Candidatus Nomurabacteria bacterium RIFCSPLOWO2_01_FULL_36_16 TaxID=1801767 RepID=A0A1F6X076_9BACT|nr:MAG: hypothetical protein A2641_03515 [Candidatus Nomurabacteria bacterium RIFCSPHIGHO2_01_FULL_37_25]OGI75557.1 MAG: hypothetical protein A3D36_03160 [Candidatus Nomurabacteria bacterium RIFCSPHIGHO2_02_FULL_36_29]OGI87395.1 MAG: hypothetical protein A3A91_02780 [Candidatus Nomurabacteria bacterium RIFCSPLOWO2_01_FULL_36_16]
MKLLTKKFKTIWWRIKSVVARYYYGNPSKKLKIVGVTGTNGKTTTVTILYKITTALGYKAGLISTVENIIVAEKIPATMTTPDSVSLTKLFAEMVSKGCEYVFMEVSSHALDQGRVNGVNFVGGIFTNLTHDHLDYHKNFENYFLAKKRFFQMLPLSAFALSNADDSYGEKILEGIKARKFFYGFPARNAFSTPASNASRNDAGWADAGGKNNSSNSSGREPDFSEKIETKLLGDFNAYNALAIFSASKLLGFREEKVKEILKNIEPPRGRFEYFTSDSGVLAIVDYAHTPDALENVLRTANGIKKENTKIISVFGCGGDRDPYKRPVMGKIGVINSDIAIFTSDNPRGENPDAIIEQMKINLSQEDLQKVKTISNRREAIKEAVKLAQNGDIILVAGKGHEDYQIIKGVKSHFDDMEELKRALA